MRIGIGLPAAVPGAAPVTGQWAGESERRGFQSLGVIDRLVYDNLDPLVALSASAAATDRIELLTTVLNVGWRGNPVLLAKQVASLDLLSGGRLTLGVGLGGWPEDYEASEVPDSGKGVLYERTLTTMRSAWAGELTGAAGPMPMPGPERPDLLFGGLVPASFTRVARLGTGWVAPLFGITTLTDGVAAVRRAWDEAGRDGRPRVVVGRYFCLGERANDDADHYIEHYYGSTYFPFARADTLTSPEALQEELLRVADAGCDDALLFPCTGDLNQVHLLADALDKVADRSPAGYHLSP